MARRLRNGWVGLAVVTLLTAGAGVRTALAREDGKIIAAPATIQTRPAEDRFALGEDEVKQLLLLLDQDQNGKVSKQEFMKFMEEEFNRLDKDENGELDVRELTRSRIRVSNFRAVGK